MTDKVRVVDWSGKDVKTLDDLIQEHSGGLKKGELVIIAARQGTGKSILWDRHVEELKRLSKLSKEGE